ncbi:MAG: BON domain-containing protein, partial [candidate division Zixibacteria bacterium]|nr:BON domain-containing protein [candidate division Zixibacteria bacterium]
MIEKYSKMRRYPGLLLLFFSLTMLFVLTTGWSRKPSTVQPLEDKDISFAIESEILMDESVPANYIDVATENGVVTLTGTVNNILARKRAAELAETVKGVRSVVNNIVVEPVLLSDDTVENLVEEALLFDPVTESLEIDVEVSERNVQLSGEVESWQEKQRAVTVAMGVKGIAEVENDIKVNYLESRADPEIEADVKSRLSGDVWVDEELIDVSVNNGVVELTGTVGSAAEKRYAIFDSWVSGVESVDSDNLQVEWWAKEDLSRSEKYTPANNNKVEESIEDAFFYDPRVAGFKIDVDVDEGVATLTGIVDNLEAKNAAKEDALNTTGVWRVKNYIRVRPENAPGDKLLEERVNKALLRHPNVEVFEIDVRAANGTVFLEGKVNTLFERQQAEKAAEKVIGVIDVVNLI